MHKLQSQNDSKQTLRVIGPLAGFTIVAGSMLGVGIFLFPGTIAKETGSVVLFFLLWLLGGLFAYSGSVACGELGAMIPRAGGDYVFQREAYGNSVAFAVGWVLFVTIFGGSIAGMSVAVFQYQIGALIGMDLMEPINGSIALPKAHILAILLIIVITLINDAGTRIAAGVQVVFTLTPMILLLTLGGYAVFSGSVYTPVDMVSFQFDAISFSGIITAFLFVNFAYSGWLNIIYVAGEVKKPGRNIPRAMTGATLVVTLMYLLMCAAFVLTLGFDGLASLGYVDAGTGMARALNSPLIANMVLVTIAIAIVTSLNATVLTSSRVAFAMAKDGAFWKGAAMLSKRQVPRRALWVQAILASLLVLSGSFEAIIEMASIAMFITGSLTVFALFVLRHKQPGRDRPYRATGYPWLPALYLLLSLIAVSGAVWQAFMAGGKAGFYPFLGVLVLLVAYVGHVILAKPRENSNNERLDRF